MPWFSEDKSCERDGCFYLWQHDSASEGGICQEPRVLEKGWCRAKCARQHVDDVVGRSRCHLNGFEKACYDTVQILEPEYRFNSVSSFWKTQKHRPAQPHKALLSTPPDDQYRHPIDREY